MGFDHKEGCSLQLKGLPPKRSENHLNNTHFEFFELICFLVGHSSGVAKVSENVLGLSFSLLDDLASSVVLVSTYQKKKVLFLFLILMCFLLCRSFGLDDEKFENENLSSNASDPEQVV